MDHIGIDVHKRESQICILAEGGELMDQRIRTVANMARSVFVFAVTRLHQSSGAASRQGRQGSVAATDVTARFGMAFQ